MIVYQARDASLQRDNDADALRRLLGVMGPQEHLVLVLQSPGGDADDAVYLRRLLHEYAKSLTIYVHTFAFSAATLMCLGADHLYMSRGAELGPMDPQVPVGLEVIVPAAQSDAGAGAGNVHVPAAAIGSFLEWAGVVAKPDANQQETVDAERLSILTGQRLNPWVIGWYEHERKSLRVYARRALSRHLLAGEPEARAETAIDYFLEHYPSHSASILRGEARDAAKLPVKDTPEDVEELLRDLHAAYMDIFDRQRVSRLLQTTDGFHAYSDEQTFDCAKCGESSDVPSRYCTDCGAPYWQVCGRCGSVMLLEWKFCGQCGGPAPGSTVG